MNDISLEEWGSERSFSSHMKFKNGSNYMLSIRISHFILSLLQSVLCVGWGYIKSRGH